MFGLLLKILRALATLWGARSSNPKISSVPTVNCRSTLPIEHCAMTMFAAFNGSGTTGSQDGLRLGHAVVASHILLPPASRVEFIVTGPSLKVKSVELSTLNIDTGPDGDNDPARPLAAIKASVNAPEPPSHREHLLASSCRALRRTFRSPADGSAQALFL